MAYCRNCGNFVNDGMNFCNYCGTSQNTFTQPVSKKVSTSAKVLGIVGMALSIYTLAYNVLMGFYSVFITSVSFVVSVNTSDNSALFFSVFGNVFLYLVLLGLAQGIASLVLGNKAVAKGNLGNAPKVARNLGIASIVLSSILVVALIFAITTPLLV